MNVKKVKWQYEHLHELFCLTLKPVLYKSCNAKISEKPVKIYLALHKTLSSIYFQHMRFTFTYYCLSLKLQMITNESREERGVVINLYKQRPCSMTQAGFFDMRHLNVDQILLTALGKLISILFSPQRRVESLFLDWLYWQVVYK